MDLLTTLLIILLAVAISSFVSYILTKRYLECKLRQEKKIFMDRSRSVLKGKVSEEFAAYFPDFPYPPTEAKFIGEPIDFIIFKGMDNKDINEVVFLEVKSGKSKINKHERNLKDTIEAKKVLWKEYRLPEDTSIKREEN